jgi:hypothetical protein
LGSLDAVLTGASFPVRGCLHPTAKMWGIGMTHCIMKAAILPLLLHAGLGFGASDGAPQLTVASGTLLRVEVTYRARLRKGSVMQGRLLEPIYAEDRLLIPSGALLQGKIVAVRPAAHGKRLDAKFHGDFTPLAEPVIQWTGLTRGDGEHFSLLAESTSGAGGTLYFRTAPAAHVSMFRRAWNTFTGQTNSALTSVKAPKKGERLQRYFWSQMPLHPQYLEEGTQYEMSLSEDLLLPAGLAPAEIAPAAQKFLPEQVSVHSRLLGDINSATAKPGDPVDAVVTQPVLDSQNQLIVPQNSILHGRVVRATASRKWGHDGTLRFTFDQVSLPSGLRQEVEATPTAVESNASNRLVIDREGGVAPQAQRGVAAPLVTGLLSASAIGDDDGGLGKAAVSSNGFAIVGHVVALSTGSRYVGGAIGAVGTGRTIYTRFLAHGKDTHFGPDTEVVVEMTPARAHRMSTGK